jgi:hypothetical protein
LWQGANPQANLFLSLNPQQGWPAMKDFMTIEGIPCDMPKLGKYVCQIRVHNNSPNKSADDVEVKLLKMEYSEETKDYYRPSIPRILMPEIKDGRPINPGTWLTFNLFYALKSEGSSGSHIYGYLVDDVQVTKQNIPFFEVNKNYQLQIMATARDFPKTVEVYNLNFISGASQCRFTLTPVSKI